MLHIPDTSDPLEEVFNNASRALNEMQENLLKMREKFGTGSQFYQRQQFLFECLATMQEQAVKEINAMREAYKLAEINQQAQRLIINSLQSGLSERQLITWLSQC